MTWKYIKTEYESIYEFANKHPEAGCFYCGKPRDVDELEFNILGTLGICKICFPDFEIGHLAADRHVVERILSKYNRRVDVINWFKRRGYELIEQDQAEDGEWKAYHFTNKTASDDKFDKHTRIEIYKDGSIHIVY